MKPLPSLVMAVLCAVLLSLTSGGTHAQVAGPKPPGKLTYQGFLTDSSGVPLGNSAPTNKTVIFRIYDDSTASTSGNLKWSSQQVVTIDKGHFSVLLGEGSAGPEGDSKFLSDLTPVFAGPTAGDRYLELTVDNTIILPRLRFLPAPYAMFAAQAQKLVNASGTDANVALRDGGNTFTGVQSIKKAGLNVLELGDDNNHSDGSVNGGIFFPGSGYRHGYFSYYPNTGFRMAASGTTYDDRPVNLQVSGTVSATEFSGNGTIPLGGIIMWSGAAGTTPPGWALCDGTTTPNGRVTPDLRGRFILGSGTGNSLTARTVNQTGGSETKTLTVAQMPPHRHGLTDPGHSHTVTPGTKYSTAGSIATGVYFGSGGDVYNNVPYRSTTETTGIMMQDAGGGQAHDIMPPYYVLAFIMRVQ